MFAFDLRWLLFALLLIFVTAIFLTIWFSHRRRRREVLVDLKGVEAVLEHTPSGWLVLDGPRTYGYANPYARRLLDLPTPSGALPEADWVPRLEEDRTTAREASVTPGCHRRVTLPSGNVACWWVMPWKDLDAVFLLDVTTQQRAEQAAAYLLSGLSHELRTPIGTILTHLEIASLPDISPETKQQSLRLLKAETQRMSRLVNQMLELGRLETSAGIEQQLLDPVALAEQALAQVTPHAAGQGVDLSLESGAGVPPVVGDPDRLMQVFLNLLDNAVKYARPGDQAVISLEKGEDGVECAICDTGPGIPARHLPHITQRFYRAAPQRIEGSGLGLALVQEILRRHGSRLKIDSQAEGAETGTCVRFVLPTLPDEEA